MADIATIAAFISSLKSATDIAKAIKDADFSLERAETKLKMAELIEALADAKMNAAEIAEVIRDKDARIQELENVLNTKGKMIHRPPVYYMEGDSVPFCPKCWEVEARPIHLVLRDDGLAECPHCQWYNFIEHLKTSRRDGYNIEY